MWIELKARVSALLAPPVPVSDQVSILVNGQLLEQRESLKDGVTTGPVRAVAEMLGADVEWDGSARAMLING